VTRNPDALSPVQGRERIASLDVIRGVAVLGILLINILVLGLPLEAVSDPTVWGGAHGANLWAWILSQLLVEGTQRGLFTILFGTGIILFTERLDAAQRPGASDLFFRRYLWLIAFGLVHGFVLLWIGDVLFFYGVLALFVYGFRKAAPKTLLMIALAGFAVNAAWDFFDLHQAMKTHASWQAAVTAQESGAQLSREQTAAMDAWKQFVAERKPDAQALQKVIEPRRHSYVEQFLFQAPIRSGLQQLYVYRRFFDFFSMMLIGMALFKSRVVGRGTSRNVYWRMVLIGYGVGLTVKSLEVHHVMVNDFSVISQLQTRVTYDLGRFMVTMGHLGALMLLCSVPILTGLKRRLAAVGQMALTNYVSHATICAFVFGGIGFGLFGQLERYQLYYVVAAIWLFQLIISPIWLRHFRFGPLEWLWRTLTYGKRQPMRRIAQGSVVADSA
jgi:uncharacterized protein